MSLIYTSLSPGSKTYYNIIDNNCKKKLLISAQYHISELVGIMFNKLDDLESNGNKDAIVNRAWEYFSKWTYWMENVDCPIRAMEYFKIWGPEKSQ